MVLTWAFSFYEQMFEMSYNIHTTIYHVPMGTFFPLAVFVLLIMVFLQNIFFSAIHTLSPWDICVVKYV